MRSPENTARFIQNWINEKVEGAGSSGVIFGLSGGVDSSVLAVLLKRAFKGNGEKRKKMLALMMPCHSSQEDLIHAKLLSEKFDIPSHVIDLTRVFDDCVKGASGICGISKLAAANTKSRLRMVTLYTVGQSMNYLVCGTSNKSEFMTGYFTKYGDSGSDLMPLADLLKREIYELAGYLDIPGEIINKPPSGGLWEGQTDEGEMGLSYDAIDRYIAAGEADAGTAEKINRMSLLSAHKRAMPPVCVIS